MSWNPQDPGETVIVYLRGGDGGGFDLEERDELRRILDEHRFEKLAPGLWGTTEFFYDLSTFDKLVKEKLEDADCCLGLYRLNLDQCGWKNLPEQT